VENFWARQIGFDWRIVFGQAENVTAMYWTYSRFSFGDWWNGAST